MSENYTLQLKKRPWYEWTLWALWFIAELFILQNAISSSTELEPRAGTIFWVTFFVLLVVAGAIWFMRRSK